MPDIATYVLCGVRPKAKATATITAEKGVGHELTLFVRKPTANGGVAVTKVTNKQGVWKVALDGNDCVVELQGVDDLDLTGVSISVDQDTSFVTYAGKGKTEAIWEGREVSTKGNPKDPWPPPGTAAELDTKWLAPIMKAINYATPRDGI